MELGFIVPIPCLQKFGIHSTYHLVLAHLIHIDAYSAWYKGRSKLGDYITLDNASFEVGDDSFNDKDLIEMALKVGAAEVMAPETAFDAFDTVDKMILFMQTFRRVKGAEKSLKVFGTVHGDTYEDIEYCYQKFLDLGVNTIGFSCRLDPKMKYKPYHQNDSLRRGLVRFEIIKRLLEDGRIDQKRRHHLLGLNHPYELSFYDQKFSFIKSNDSSAAYLAGVTGVNLRVMSYEKPNVRITFLFAPKLTQRTINTIYDNITYLKNIAKSGVNSNDSKSKSNYR